MIEMKYLDTNVFVFPVLYDGEKSKRAREIVRSIFKRKEKCATSTLTLDEVLWAIITRTKDRDLAIDSCEDILSLKNLKILNVTSYDVKKAIWFMNKYQHLQPRDAIHLAVCNNSNIHTIITDDSDFEIIEEIRKEGL